MGQGIKVVHECPYASAYLIPKNRISDPPTDRVRHIHRGVLVPSRYETNSYRPTLTPPRGCGEKRELPSGSNPTGHRLRPSIGDGPCHDGPLERHGQREYASSHENRAFLPFSAYLADRYASRQSSSQNVIMRFAVPPGGRWRAAGDNLTPLISPPRQTVQNGCMVTLPE